MRRKYHFVLKQPFYENLNDYKLVIMFIIASLVLTILLFYVSFALVYNQRDVEKTSSYECGFQPFEDSRQRFDIKYYLVAILFIIFDLEIMCVVPWTQVYESTHMLGLTLLSLFLGILVIGFMYEWVKGALIWN